MADVVIIPDFEAGHIFPTFRMARNLQHHGLRVAYAGISDVMGYVQEQGFDSHLIMKDLYPGSRSNGTTTGMSESAFKQKHFSLLLSGCLDELFLTLKPKLIFFSYFISLEALLLHYKYRIPQVIYHTFLPFLDPALSSSGLSHRAANLCIKNFMELPGDVPDLLLTFIQKQGVSFKVLDDLVAPLKQMPQVMLCPKEFTIGEATGKTDLYIGPCIRDVTKNEQAVYADLISSHGNKKLIFASMGSQIREYPEKVNVFFKLMLECMRQEQMSSFHLLLSVGTDENLRRLEPLPENVSAFPWLPQTALLEHTSVAILHGGLGSVKECIYYGVPMVILPMGRDQMDNAQRVRHHNLGLTDDIDSLTVQKLTEMIMHVYTDQAVQRNVKNMMAIFRERENSSAEVELVRNYMNSVVSPV